MSGLGLRTLLAATVTSLLFMIPAQASEPAETTELDLGTHSPGARLTATVAAHNVSCKGRQDFDLVVRDAAWITSPTASNDLRRIRKGKRKSTTVVVDTTGLEPGTHRGRIDVQCLTCPTKCYQDRTSLEVVVAVRGGTADVGDRPGGDGESGGSASPYRFDPRNPENPFDTYGERHNLLLDQIAADRHLLETAGVVLPSSLAGYVAERVCDDLDPSMGSRETCRQAAFIEVAALSMAAKAPISHYFEIAGFSPRQRSEVRAIEAAISRAFREDNPEPEAAIGQIRQVEGEVLRRGSTGFWNPGPGPCPYHWPWPGPCGGWLCRIFPWLCTVFPPFEGPILTYQPIDGAILAASSVARYSITYWDREIAEGSPRWSVPASPEESEETEPDVGDIVRQDFKGMFLGGLNGLFDGGVPGVVKGAVEGATLASAEEAGGQFGWW